MSIVGGLPQEVRRFITDAPVDGKVRARKDGEWGRYQKIELGLVEDSAI
ncbi:MAG: hypothetical protein RBR82_15815 [Pseudomonas sp.]|nr:hypothetical protein [Pseudomonas sp.]